MEMIFHCRPCEVDFRSASVGYRCPTCSGPLDLDLPARAFPREAIASRPPDLWRYAEALPRFEHPVTLGERMTPLVPLEVGPLQVLAKCDFLLPSGSYKDRGAALLVTYLQSMGITDVVEDSSGNAGAALAAYTARAGIRLRVFCPRSAAAGKLAQILLHGADLVRVEGPRPRATEALLDHLETADCTYASHLWHPLFLEGVRTLAYEIAEQLEWTAPDYVLCPVGAGSILLGLYLGFGDLVEAGVIEQLPRLVAVQARNASAVCAAYERGADSVEPLAEPPATMAEGIALPAPVRDTQVMEAMRVSGGRPVAVAEPEILEGLRAFGRAGFCVEPTSAVVWHGLLRLHEAEPIPPGATIVLVLSGNGLKASAQIAEMLGA